MVKVRGWSQAREWTAHSLTQLNISNSPYFVPSSTRLRRRTLLRLVPSYLYEQQPLFLFEGIF